MRRFALLVALAAVAGSFTAAGGIVPARAGGMRYSPAQKALFATPHLANITTRETITYRYVHVGPRPFTGSVAEAVTPVGNAGLRDVRVKFLPTSRYAATLSFPGFRGNPMVMVFLQHDVTLMHREFAYTPDFFRNKIRDALLLSATVSPVTVTAGGRKLAGERILLHPFAGNPHFANLPAVTGKSYSFVLAPKVPGMLVSITAITPADPQSGAPRLEDRMTYQGVHP